MASQNISPFLRSPFTDLTGGMVSHQLLGRCAKEEMVVADCLEWYGIERGMRLCKDYIEDFKECHTLRKQFLRFIALRDERDRQIGDGELKGEKKYVSPRVDSY